MVLAIGLFPWTDHPAFGADTATVVEVVDGDTIRVRMHDEIATVRMIGIDTAERGHPSRPKEFMADEATDALSALVSGKSVRLEKDLEESDKYGRQLRYVFSEDGRILFNREMVRKGLARVYRRFPFTRLPELEAAESKAKAEGLGLWADHGLDELRWVVRSHNSKPVTVWPLGGGEYGIALGGMGKAGIGGKDLQSEIANLARMNTEMADAEFVPEARKAGYGPVDAERSPDADKAVAGPPASGIVSWEQARGHLGREVTVEGIVVRVKQGRKAVFLNFHDNWKRYPTVVLFTGRVAGLPDDPETFYRGRKIRVRGTVTLYKERPEIVVGSAEDIRIVP